MNFEALKAGFFTYLQEKLASEKNAEQTDLKNISDASIFMYQDEFKEYLQHELGANSSLFNANIYEIMSNGIDSSQLEISDEKNKNSEIMTDLISQMLSSTNDNGSNRQINENELNMLLSSLDGSQTLSLTDITSADIFENSYVLNNQKTQYDFISSYNIELTDFEQSTLDILFDTDKDGTVSENEKQQAEKLLSAIDTSHDKITKEDITLLQNYIKELTKLGFSESEIAQNIMGLDNDANTLSESDFAQIANELQNGASIQELQAASNAGINPNSVMESNGGGTESSGKTPKSPAIAKKNLDNMSIRDLESELTNAKNQVKDAQNSYLNEVEKLNSELASKIKTVNSNIETTNGKLDDANTQLDNCNSQLKKDKQDLNDAKNRVGDINSEISALEAQKKLPNANLTEINSKIKALKEEKKKLESETIPTLNDSIDKLENEIDELNNNTIPNLEKTLSEYKEELTQYEQEVNELANGNDGLKALQNAYTEAVSYQSSVESKLELRKADREQQENSDRPDNSEAPKDYSGNENYDMTNMPITYNLDGKEYHCVGFSGYDLDGDGEIDFKPDSWEEVQRYFANGGVANIGKYGSMQCHNYSDMMGQFILGDVNQEFVQALYDETNNPDYGDLDMAGKLAKQGKYNPRRFAQCKSANRDEERAIIENELQNGRPVLVSVPYTGGQHWVAAVGMSDDGDILIWDSYNGSMEKLGCSSNSDKNKLHRNMATGNGIMVYCEDYSYQYKTAKLIDYWKYVGNSPEYVRQNGYK